MEIHPTDRVRRLMSVGEWRALVNSRWNVLFQGTDGGIDIFVTALTPHLTHPIQTCFRWPPLSMTSREGTLILREVEALDASQQRDLLRWLGDAGARVQVISVASTPVFPLVEDGLFLDSLYYRPNDIEAAIEGPHGFRLRHRQLALSGCLRV